MTTGPRKRFTDWRTFVGVGLAIGLLVFSLRGISLDEVMGEIARANPILFLASIVLAVGPMLVRAWRWKALLEPVCPGTSFYSRFSTTMIGFMANNVLPARVGEVARAYALPRVEPITTIASVGSLVVERLRSEEHTSELQSRGHLVCRLLLEKNKNTLLLSGKH